MFSQVTRRRLAGAFLTLLLLLLLQNVIAIAHEYAHSMSAWLLGYTPTPFTVVWGNPLMVTGWDEGVPYDRLFPRPGNVAEAVTGGIPLFMQSAFAVASLLVLQRPFPRRRRRLFFVLYWFAVLNVAEMVAYIVMRPFIATGDTGRFNHGMAIPPWPLFIGGTMLLAFCLWTLARKVGPNVTAFTGGSRFEYGAIILASAFIMFLWGSGLRMMLLYPDPQWTVGLIGVAAFPAWVLAAGSPASRPPRPARAPGRS